MKRDEKQKYRKIPETPEEHMSMRGYDLGFNDGYLQAQYDHMPEKQKKHLDDFEKALFDVVNSLVTKE